MFCRQCGKPVADQAVVCVGCGCPPLAGNKFCQSCGVETNPVAVACIKCGASLKAPAPAASSSDNKEVFLGLNQTGVIIGVVLFCFCLPLCWLPLVIPACKADPKT